MATDSKMKSNNTGTSGSRARKATNTATTTNSTTTSSMKRKGAGYKLHIWGKVLERNCLTFLSTRWGMTLTVVMSFVTLDILLYGVQMAFFTHSQNRPAVLSEVRDILTTDAARKAASSPTDNIAHKSFMDILLPEPIDIVYTWVNGSDPEHAAALRRFKEEVGGGNSSESTNATLNNGNATLDGNNTSPSTKSDELSASRFQDNDELIFSLRSVEKYAPWVRRIWLVTNGQVPSWLDLNNPHITVVTHKEIFPNASHLPTFSSPAIESHLHRIPGLSSRFIYLNDDVMFGAPVWPDDFHTVSGGQKIFFSWPVPNCADGCMTNWLGDGFCDQACNVSECDYDNGDCLGNHSQTNFNNAQANNMFRADLKRTEKYCTRACPDSWLGDKFCDKACQIPECGFDASDCGTEKIYSELPGYVPVNGGVYVVPNDTLAVYFNYTSLYSDLINPVALNDGDFGSTEIVRTAVISIKSSILVVTLNRNVTLNSTNITLNVSDANGALHNLSFTLVVDTSNYDAAVKEKLDRLEREAMERRASGSDHGENITDGNATQFNATEFNATGNINTTSNMTSNTTANASSTTSGQQPPPKKSNKIDTFGESLKYVNRLYSRKYGAEARKVPAHMPHFIDTRVMRELQAEFPAQFEETSSHQLRSGQDMQYSFSYMYHIIDRPEEFDLAGVWYEYFDTDGSGSLDDNEFWTLLIYLWGGSPTSAQYNETMAQINNCTNEAWPVTLSDFEKCNATVEKLRSAMSKRKKYKHEEYDTTTVGFIMVGNNDTTLQGKLDGIRLKRHKFICLNDNLNHSDPDSVDVLKMLRDFYVSMYPNRSSFELPEGVTNPYLHVDEIRVAEQSRRTALARKISLVISLAFAVFIAIGCLSITAVKRDNYF